MPWTLVVFIPYCAAGAQPRVLSIADVSFHYSPLGVLWGLTWWTKHVAFPGFVILCQADGPSDGLWIAVSPPTFRQVCRYCVNKSRISFRGFYTRTLFVSLGYREPRPVPLPPSRRPVSLDMVHAGFAGWGEPLFIFGVLGSFMFSWGWVFLVFIPKMIGE